MNTQQFIKENFSYSGGFLTYHDGDDNHFIGRFKYVGKASAMKFANFLRKNFTTAEYLDRLDNGEAPLEVLESKGYCSPQMASLAKRWGYAPTLENAHRALVDQTNEDLVRMGEKPTMTYEKYKEHLQRSA